MENDFKSCLARIPEKDREIVERWILERRASGLSENSIRTYIIVSGFLSRLAPKPILELDREDVLRLLIKVQEETKGPAIYKQVLRNLLRCNGKEELIQGIRLNKREQKKEWQDPANLLTREEIMSMLSHASDLRDRAAIGFLWDSGCRAHEMLAVDIGDLAFHKDKKTLVTVFFRKQKTAGVERRIPLYEASKVILDWLRAHPYRDNGKAPLFVSNYKKRKERHRLGNSGLSKIIKSVSKAAGIEKNVYAHLFRHSRATYLRKRGTPDESLRYWFGWTRDSDMPVRYISRKDGEHVTEIAKALGVEPLQEPAPPEELLPEDFIPDHLTELREELERDFERKMRETLRDEFDKKLDELFQEHWVMPKDKSLAPLWLPVPMDSEDAVGKCTKCQIGYTEIHKRQFGECQRCGDPIQWDDMSVVE